MTCPFLAYREAADGQSFDTARAYCTAAETFVEAMRADICNDRYDLDHETDCEIFLAHADDDGTSTVETPASDGDSQG